MTAAVSGRKFCEEDPKHERVLRSDGGSDMLAWLISSSLRLRDLVVVVAAGADAVLPTSDLTVAASAPVSGRA
jgi:hypothetical protein